MEFFGLGDRYRVIDVIGEGGFGTVFLALDTKFARHVALKVTKRKLTKEVSHRFRREAIVTQRLRHPNIVKVYDMDINDDTPYIAMEYLEADDLDKQLTRRKFSIEESLYIVSQIASALAYLEDRGLVHRDIKPANIIVNENDLHATLMDFGLVLLDDATVITKTGRLVGTPHYLAPEMWFGAEYTPASDIYALGLVLHQLLVGEFVLGGVKFIPRKVIEPPLPSQYNDNVPPAIDALFAWSTATDVDVRCPNAKAFLDKVAHSGKAGLAAVRQVDPEIAPELCIENDEVTEEVVEKPTRIIEENIPRPRSYFRIFVFLAFFIAIGLVTYGSFQSDQHHQSRADQLLRRKFSVFPNGLVFRFAGLFDTVPHYSLSCSGKVLCEGECTLDRDAYCVERWDLPVELAKEPHIFQISIDGKTVFRRPFTPPESSFSKGPYARAGKNCVELSWQLHGEADVVVKYRWSRVGEYTSLLAKNNGCKLVPSRRSGSVEYELFVGEKSIYRDEVYLGCVSRRDKILLKEKPGYQLDGKIVHIDNDILANPTGSSLVCLAFIINGSGPHVYEKWMAKSDYPANTVPLFIHGDRRGIVHSIGGSKLTYSLIDLSSREKCQEAEQPIIGKAEGEWRLTHPKAVAKATLVQHKIWSRQEKERKSVYCGLALLDDKRLNLFTIDESGGKGRLVEGKTFSSALDAKIAPLIENRFIIIRTIKDECRARVLTLSGAKDVKLELGKEVSLFDCPVSSLLPSMPDEPPSSSSELDVHFFGKNKIFIRVGRRLTLVRMIGDELLPSKGSVIMEVKCRNRISTPLFLNANRLLMVTVQSNDSMPAYSEAIRHFIDVENGMFVLKDTRTVAKTAHIGSREARCNVPYSWNGRWYMPVLNNVIVFDDKIGMKRNIFDCQTRPNSAFVIDGTLIVPSACREIRGVCLID